MKRLVLLMFVTCVCQTNFGQERVKNGQFSYELVHWEYNRNHNKGGSGDTRTINHYKARFGAQFIFNRQGLAAVEQDEDGRVGYKSVTSFVTDSVYTFYKYKDQMAYGVYPLSRATTRGGFLEKARVVSRMPIDTLIDGLRCEQIRLRTRGVTVRDSIDFEIVKAIDVALPIRNARNYDFIFEQNLTLKFRTEFDGILMDFVIRDFKQGVENPEWLSISTSAFRTTDEIDAEIEAASRSAFSKTRIVPRSKIEARYNAHGWLKDLVVQGYLGEDHYAIKEAIETSSMVDSLVVLYSLASSHNGLGEKGVDSILALLPKFGLPPERYESYLQQYAGCNTDPRIGDELWSVVKHIFLRDRLDRRSFRKNLVDNIRLAQIPVDKHIARDFIEGKRDLTALLLSIPTVHPLRAIKGNRADTIQCIRDFFQLTLGRKAADLFKRPPAW